MFFSSVSLWHSCLHASLCSSAILRKQMRHETWCLCIRECLRIAWDFAALPAYLQRLSLFEQTIEIAVVRLPHLMASRVREVSYVFANMIWTWNMFALLLGFAMNFAIAEYFIKSKGRIDAQAILVPLTLPSTATCSTIRRPQAQQCVVLSLLFPLEFRFGFYYKPSQPQLTRPLACQQPWSWQDCVACMF